MDHWTLAIEKNRNALTQIVAGLFVMVGSCLTSASPSGSRPSLDELRSSADQWFTDCAALSRKAGLATERVCADQDGKSTITLTSIKRRILMRVLRTTEAALRRLIVLYVNVHGIKAKALNRSNRPLPDFASFGSGSNKRTPVFRLFDPRKSLCFISDSTSGLRAPLDGASLVCRATVHVQASRLVASTGTATEGDHSDSKTHNSLLGEPRIWIMGNSDWSSLRVSRSKCDQHLCHCVSVRSLDSEQETNSTENKQTEQERKSSQKLLTRLAALEHALKTIPKQARRLAQIMAQRKNAPAGIKCIPPIRPGIPPGHAQHSKAPEQETLRECHGLLRDWERSPPDR